jgi:hypothetical protein
METHVDKVLLALVLCASCLVLEDHIVVPPSLKGVVLLVEEGIPEGDISLPRFRLCLGPLFFL